MVLGAGWARRARAERAAGRGRQQCAGRAGRAQQGCGRRAAWAHGLALGSALGALGPFSIRFDSFFFPESLNEHCSL